MRGHLSDDEMLALVTGELAGEGRDHLRACATCRKEWVRLQASLVGLAAELRAEAQAFEGVLPAQRAAITRRLAGACPRPGGWRWAWAPILAGAAVALVLLVRGGSPPPPAETDEALLRSVQQAIQTPMPTALQPADLLLAEVERNVEPPERQIDGSKGDPS